MPAPLANLPTLVDITRAQDPDGSIAAVAELLTQTNEMLVDIPFLEGNLPTGHRTTVRTGIPAPTWREFYQGVMPGKSTRAQVTDSCAMLEAYAEVDKALADLNGNAAAFRLSEDYAHIEGISQAVQQAFIYGNMAANPQQFNGLTPRFNSLAADNAENIISGGGTGVDNASIWLVVWGPNTCHGIYPKGSVGGLQMQDMGEVTIENMNGDGGRMQAYRSHYKWSLGLSVRDWRYVVRIPNIDRSDLKPDLSTGANLCELMFRALERLPTQTLGQPVFYMDRSLATMYRQQLPNAVKNATLQWTEVGGIKAMDFQGVPIRRVDRLAVNEARVV